MAFERVKRLKVAEQVVGAIRGAIVRGQYQAGDTLPSERVLATQFGVNRSSVREALLRLEAWGLVHIKQGGATRVRDVFYSAGLHILPYLVAPDDRIDDKLLADVLAVRVMFLAWTAEHAATHATPDDVEQLRQTVAALDDATDAQTLQRLDFEFFEHLVAAGRNRVLTLFTNALREIYDVNREHMAFLYRESFDASHHRSAVDAIADGDGAAAARAMRAYGARGTEALG
ncbi:MAG: GntR family transcriptional regulator [Deltaproteobacteria bacterium]|nr:GntR family transcriptional regulator [Deltaproteobacteria bacterium]